MPAVGQAPKFTRQTDRKRYFHWQMAHRVVTSKKKRAKTKLGPGLHSVKQARPSHNSSAHA